MLICKICNIDVVGNGYCAKHLISGTGYYTHILTEPQQKLLEFIRDKNNWNPPTYKQMREFMGFKSNQSIADVIKALNKKGYNPNH